MKFVIFEISTPGNIRRYQELCEKYENDNFATATEEESIEKNTNEILHYDFFFFTFILDNMNMRYGDVCNI